MVSCLRGLLPPTPTLNTPPQTVVRHRTILEPGTKVQGFSSLPTKSLQQLHLTLLKAFPTRSSQGAILSCINCLIKWNCSSTTSSRWLPAVPRPSSRRRGTAAQSPRRQLLLRQSRLRTIRSRISSGPTLRNLIAHAVWQSSKPIQRFESLLSSTISHVQTLITAPDHQALRSRASHEVCRRRCRRPPDCLRMVPPINALLLPQVLGHRIRDRCHRQPEPVPRHPRDLSQPCLPQPHCQPTLCHLCEPADWCAVQCFVQGMLRVTKKT